MLVFFDARHPEPGTMQDTLQHLVAETIHRTDSSKFLYVLNQMDNTARENNPEDIVGSWQRALAQKGLTAGRFYCIYSPGAAIAIEDDAVRARFEQKRDVDLAEIHGRLRQVEVDRAYRVMGVLEHGARDIELRLVPRLQEMVTEWRRRVRLLDGIAFAVLFAVVLVWTLCDRRMERVAFLASLLVRSVDGIGVGVRCPGGCGRSGGLYPSHLPAACRQPGAEAARGGAGGRP